MRTRKNIGTRTKVTATIKVCSVKLNASVSPSGELKPALTYCTPRTVVVR